MCCGAEAGSYLRLIDSCITQLKAQGPSRTCNESKEEEEGFRRGKPRAPWEAARLRDSGEQHPLIQLAPAHRHQKHTHHLTTPRAARPVHVLCWLG